MDRERLRSLLEVTLDKTLDRTSPESLGIEGARFYEGKVRDNYSFPDGTRLLVVTDRISAFDRVLTTLPFKGQVLNGLASYWFEKTKHIADNHALSTPDPQALIGRECAPLPVEIVVRAYLTGVTSTSIWTHYKEGGRSFCGHALPDGMKKNEKLERPIVTPSTKAEKGGHDVSLSREEVLALGQVSPAHFDRMSEIALSLFAFGQAVCEERGLILVDTKYEFGLDQEGKVVLIDEIHTPDSSRFWFRESYAERLGRGEEPSSFDKEYVRRHLAERGFMGDGEIPPIPSEVRVEASMRYIEAYERIVGRAFEPNVEEPLGRLRRNLAKNQQESGTKEERR